MMEAGLQFVACSLFPQCMNPSGASPIFYTLLRTTTCCCSWFVGSKAADARFTLACGRTSLPTLLT